MSYVEQIVKFRCKVLILNKSIHRFELSGMAIQFDTLRYAEKLKSAGISEGQAKAEAEALATALDESGFSHLATKDGIRSIKNAMADIKSELKLMKWMEVVSIAGVISLVAKAFF